MTNNNVAKITGHLDAALVALQTAKDDLALAVLLAEQDGDMKHPLGYEEAAALKQVQGAVAVAQLVTVTEQQKWDGYLRARETAETGIPAGHTFLLCQCGDVHGKNARGV